MSYVTRLLEIYLLERGLRASRVNINNMMISVASILFLVVACLVLGLMSGIVLYAIFYILMISNGMTPIMALSLLLAVTVLALLFSAERARQQWNKLKDVFNAFTNTRSTITGVGHKMLEAFMDGFERGPSA